MFEIGKVGKLEKYFSVNRFKVNNCLINKSDQYTDVLKLIRRNCLQFTSMIYFLYQT